MKDKNKLFSSMGKLTVGLVAGAAYALAPISAHAVNNDGFTLVVDHGCNGEKKGDKECGGDKDCGGDKGCGGEGADHGKDHAEGHGDDHNHGDDHDHGDDHGHDDHGAMKN